MALAVLFRVFLLGHCWRSPSVEGVTFSLRGNSITNDGSGSVLITDINPDGDSNEDALICHSEIDTFTSTYGNWYLATEISTDDGDRIVDPDPRGWLRNRSLKSGHQLLRLRRVSATAEEGVFTCNIPGDDNSPRALSIYYPISSVTASIDVASGRRTFRVRCTSSGGKAVSMSVTGPGGFSEDLDNILAVGTPQRRGNDSFSDSTDIIKLSGESDGQVYECTASNGVSSDPTASVELRVANPPTITLQQLSLTSVRVTWSQPPGGATVMRYIVHYSDGDTHTNKTVSSSSTSYDITGLTVGATYTFSVEATSQHLSGESEMTITLQPPPAAPAGVMVDAVDDTSVRVSWGTVSDTDRYTVTFIKTRTMETQQGVCIPAEHVVSVSVDAPSTSTSPISVSIGVGQMLESEDVTMLRAYTTYSITVVAVNDVTGSSGDSVAIPVTTTQIRATAAPRSVIAIVVNSTVITVQWDGLDPCIHANGRIVLYRVQYTEVASGVVKSVNVTGEWNVDNAMTSLTELTPITNYSIQVAAVNEEDEVGVYSDPLVRQTNEDTPGLVVMIAAFPSFFKIRITWSPPERPYGSITEYEVSYEPTDSSQPPTTNNTGLETSFTTPSNLKKGTEFIFSVRASTSVGFGETASVTVSTLTQPPAVEGVTVTARSDTAVNVSWNAVIIPDFSVDFYTVVYSPVSLSRRRQDGGEMSAVFSPPATSGVIGGLDSDTDYQFQVFATVTVDGEPLEGEGSTSVRFIIVRTRNSECESSRTPLIIGVTIGIIGVLVGTSGLIITCITVKQRKESDDKIEMTTEGNPAYGLCGPHEMHGETKDEYEYIQSSAAAPQETV